MLKKLLLLLSLTSASTTVLGMFARSQLEQKGCFPCLPSSGLVPYDQRNTPVELLWMTCKEGEAIKVESMLNTLGVHPNTRLFFDDGCHNSTCLHYAAELGHAKVVTLLLERGASLNPLDQYGWTPLSRALSKDQEEVVDVLLARDAKVTGLDAMLHTPLALPIERLHPALVAKLINAKAPINGSFKSPIFARDIIRLQHLHTLLKRLNLERLKPETTCLPMYSAGETEERALEIIALLRQAGAHLDEVNYKNKTIFHLVAPTNNTRFVCALMVPIPTEVRKDESRSQFFTLLLCLKRLSVKLPKDMRIALLAHMPIITEYAGWKHLVVPVKISKSVFHRKFLDDTWGLLPELLNHEERAHMHQILNKKNTKHKYSKDCTDHGEIQILLDPETWETKVELKHA